MASIKWKGPFTFLKTDVPSSTNPLLSVVDSTGLLCVSFRFPVEVDIDGQGAMIDALRNHLEANGGYSSEHWAPPTQQEQILNRMEKTLGQMAERIEAIEKRIGIS